MVALIHPNPVSADLAASFMVVSSEAVVRLGRYDRELTGRLPGKALRELRAVIDAAPGPGEVRRRTASILASLAFDSEAVVAGCLQVEGAWAEDATWAVWERQLPAPYWGAVLREAKVDPAVAGVVRRKSKTASYRDIIKSGDWKERMNKWSKKLRKHDPVAEIIASGLAHHAKPETIAKSIEPYVRGYSSSAMRIVRTETARVLNEVTEETFKTFDNVIVGFQILTMLDSRVRPTHAARHGRMYSKNAKRPRLPDAPNCRCRYAPILEDEEDVMSVPGVPKFSTDTYDKWFSQQPEEVKRKLVGKQRWELVKKKVSKPQWQDFSNRKTGELLSPGTLRERSSGQIKKRRRRRVIKHPLHSGTLVFVN